MDGLYANAKQKHADGLQLLVENFQYHPLFKLGKDPFVAVPFKPM